LERLTADQFQEWMEYAQAEPFGFPGEDARHGILCATVAAPYAKPGSAPAPRDFMLQGSGTEEGSEPTPEETEAALESLLGPVLVREQPQD
jgi:hypothetical protein